MAEQQKAPVSSSTTDESVRPVLIVDQEALGDLSVFLRHFFVGLADESGKAALVCPPDCDVNSLLAPSIEVIRHPAYRTPILWRQSDRKLIEKLGKFKPNILHCLGRGTTNLTTKLAEQLDLPYVQTINSLQSRLQKCSISASRCAAIITPTETLASHLVSVYSKFGQRIRQINMGTFVDGQCACFSVPSRVTSMVVACRLNDASDFELLFTAIKHLAIEGHEFIMLLIGTGPAERNVRELRRTLGLSQVVYILPDIQPLRSIFASADVFVQPQPTKIFSFSLLEAMSVGMVVAGCAGGVDDLLIDNQTAALFEPADELSIYACIKRLLEKREFSRQIASGAQSYLKKDYTVSTMVSSILETYRNSLRWYKTQASNTAAPKSKAQSKRP